MTVVAPKLIPRRTSALALKNSEAEGNDGRRLFANDGDGTATGNEGA